MNIKVSLEGCASSRELEASILAHARVLAPFFDDIVNCSVHLRSEDGDELYDATLYLTLQGGEVVVVDGSPARCDGVPLEGELDRVFTEALRALRSRRLYRATLHRPSRDAYGW